MVPVSEKRLIKSAQVERGRVVWSGEVGVFKMSPSHHKIEMVDVDDDAESCFRLPDGSSGGVEPRWSVRLSTIF